MSGSLQADSNNSLLFAHYKTASADQIDPHQIVQLLVLSGEPTTMSHLMGVEILP
jgi:hypothetical protein